jgi:hypothetical protein
MRPAGEDPAGLTRAVVGDMDHEWNLRLEP